MPNPFRDLYDHCNIGTAASKNAFIDDHPTIIDVELTNGCNFGCVFCPTGNRAMRRRTGVMEPDTMVELMLQAQRLAARAKKKIGVRFIGWGEPTMAPANTLLSAIAMGSDDFDQHGVVTHLNTNGSYLDVKDGVSSYMLISTGLHSIKFSFQGVTRESYRQARQIDYFDELFDKIASFREQRDRYSDNGLPWIGVSTSTTYETEEMVASFIAKFSAVADEISVGKTILGFFDEDKMAFRSLGAEDDYQLLKDNAATDLKHPDPCPEVWDKLTISWDGTARVCCNDYDGVTDLGNINEVTLETMWTDSVMQAYRERLARKEYSGPLCSVCYDYQGNTQGG